MIKDYVQRLRLFNRDVRLLLVTAALIGFVNFGIVGVLLNLYLLRIGYGPEFIGLVFGIFSISWAVFSLPSGTLGRLWSIRRTMILGMAIVPIAAGMFPFTESVPQDWRTGWLVISCLLWGTGFAFFIVNAIPFLTAKTGDAERPHAFSVWLALIPLAGFAGALIAGLLPGLLAGWLGVSLDSPAPFRYPLWLGAVLYVPALAALIATDEVVVDRPEATSQSEGRAPVGLLLALGTVTFLTKAAAAAPQNFFNVYLDDALGVSPARIGTLVAVAQLGGALSVLLAPVLMARFGKRRTYIGAASLAAISILPLAPIPHWAVAGLAYLSLYVGGMIVDAAFNVFSQESVAPGWRPTVAGVGLTAEGASRTLVGVAGGLAIVAFGYRTLFLVVAVIAAMAALVFWLYFRGPRGEEAPV